jgi:hypothetical protein
MMNDKLQDWFMENKPDDKLIYKDDLARQIMFIRDTIIGLLARSYEEYNGIQEAARVISTHTSKSVNLPVMEINWNGWTFRLRYNFHDWKVSVHAPYKFKDIEIDFMKLFDPTVKINSAYCEGFEDSWVYGPYSENKREYTIEIGDNVQLYVYFWIIRTYAHKEG